MSINKFCLCAAGVMTIATMGVTLAPAEAQGGLTVVGQRQNVPVAKVRYGDLDLASAAGERRLWSRIALAIDSVCPAFDRHSLDDAEAIRACRTTAKASADPQAAAAISRDRSGGSGLVAASAVITITPG